MVSRSLHILSKIFCYRPFLLKHFRLLRLTKSPSMLGCLSFSLVVNVFCATGHMIYVHMDGWSSTVEKRLLPFKIHWILMSFSYLLKLHKILYGLYTETFKSTRRKTIKSKIKNRHGNRKWEMLQATFTHTYKHIS